MNPVCLSTDPNDWTLIVTAKALRPDAYPRTMITSCLLSFVLAWYVYVSQLASILQVAEIQCRLTWSTDRRKQ